MSSPPPIGGEFDLIRRYFQVRAAASGAARGVILGIGDDAALLQLPEDTELVAAVHFLIALLYVSAM